MSAVDTVKETAPSPPLRQKGHSTSLPASTASMSTSSTSSMETELSVQLEEQETRKATQLVEATEQEAAKLKTTQQEATQQETTQQEATQQETTQQETTEDSHKQQQSGEEKQQQQQPRQDDPLLEEEKKPEETKEQNALVVIDSKKSSSTTSRQQMVSHHDRLEQQQEQIQLLHSTIIFSSLFSSGSFFLLLLQVLELRVLFSLFFFCSSGGLLGYSLLKRLLLEYQMIVQGNGFSPYLPESLRRTLVEDSLHEFMTAENEMLNEYQFMMLYFLPGMSKEQLESFIQRLAPKHRKMLKQKGLGHLLGPEFMRVLQGEQNSNSLATSSSANRGRSLTITPHVESTTATATITIPTTQNANRSIELMPSASSAPSSSPQLEQSKQPTQVTCSNNNYDDFSVSSASSDLGLDITTDDVTGGISETQAFRMLRFLRLKGADVSRAPVPPATVTPIPTPVPPPTAVATTATRDIMLQQPDDNQQKKDDNTEADSDDDDDNNNIDFKQFYTNLLTDAFTATATSQMLTMRDLALSYVKFKTPPMSRVINGSLRSAAMTFGLYTLYAKRSAIFYRPIVGLTTRLFRNDGNNNNGRIDIWWIGTGILGATSVVGTMLWGRSLIMAKGLTSSSLSSSSASPPQTPATPPEEDEKQEHEQGKHQQQS